MRMKAYRLARVDKEYDMHLQAWLNHAVTATKEKGNKHVPAYKSFKDFYDYEKELKKIEQPKQSIITPHQRKMAKLAAMVNKERG